MIISSSNIGMESARSFQKTSITVRHFSITDYQGSLTQSGNALNTAVKDSQEESEEKSGQSTSESTNTLNNWQSYFGISSSRMNIRSSSSNTLFKMQQLTLRYIFDRLFSAQRGRFGGWMSYNGMNSMTMQETAQTNTASVNVQPVQNISELFTANLKVLNYTQETFQMETENTSFSTVGTVRTSDGREINFNVNVGMSREFEEYYKEELDLASFQWCDPLVINMDTDAAQLSDQTFYFDIDADGELDEISQLGSGSGYLALDKNGDGIINDGSELFGTASGNGFADLAEYDEDGNGWIDENDSIWSKLKIWTKDENGNDVLYRLADKGVGAICLQNVSTDFTLKGGDGQTQGAIRNTGVFLYENGNVGTIQHVDLAKYNKEA